MSNDLSKQCAKDIEAAIYYIQHNEVFMCGLIQEINMRLDPGFPFAAYIGYDKKRMKFIMGFNPDMFTKFTRLEQASILQHECMHFLHKHLIRFKEETETTNDQERMVKNIAADMSINQYLPDLPEGSINIKDWKTAKGQPLDPYKSYEYYYNEIKESLKDQYKKDKPKDGKGKPGKGDGPSKIGPNDEQMTKYKPMDEHDWESLTEEEKEQMLQEAKNLIKRTLEKTQYDHSMVPGSVKDLLEELDSQLEKMDYNSILRKSVKKTVAVSNRDSTWKKPNKRFGNVAPGTTIAKLPNISVYQDTSGSMSHIEINEGNTIIDGFLKVGGKKCFLGLFHTSLYSFKKRRLGEIVETSEIESGGTDLTEVIDHIYKNRPNLAIILTDGQYSDVNIKEIKGTEIIFIIRDNNNLDHPLKRFGKTIPYSAIK